MERYADNSCLFCRFPPAQQWDTDWSNSDFRVVTSWLVRPYKCKSWQQLKEFQAGGGKLPTWWIGWMRGCSAVAAAAVAAPMNLFDSMPNAAQVSRVRLRCIPGVKQLPSARLDLRSHGIWWSRSKSNSGTEKYKQLGTLNCLSMRRP
jgi:hypothetical protein